MAFYHFEGIRRATNIAATHNFQSFRWQRKRVEMKMRRGDMRIEGYGCNWKRVKWFQMLKEKENGKYLKKKDFYQHIASMFSE